MACRGGAQPSTRHGGHLPQPGMGLTTATYLSQFSLPADRLDRQDTHSGQDGLDGTWMEEKIRKQKHKMGRQTETHKPAPLALRPMNRHFQGC